MREHIKLKNGKDIPLLGLGVWKAAPGKETREAVSKALELGYRHIDTATLYGNESDVGVAVRESGIPRSEIFVTTKLWNSDHGFQNALAACEKSLSRLAIDYIDLYLIHWPVPSLRLQSWKALEKLHRDGLVRSIGVSNYMVNHLEELHAVAEVAPVINQIEVHPFLQHFEVRKWCEEHGVVVEAYSPLTRGHRLDDLLISSISESIGRTPAQVFLRWGIQKKMVVLPKSTNPQRIAENMKIFDFNLSDEEMENMDSLEEGFATAWDPRGTA